MEETLKDREPVNVSLFDLVADIHDVDVYTLEPQRLAVTGKGYLHAIRFTSEKGAVQGWRSCTRCLMVQKRRGITRRCCNVHY